MTALEWIDDKRFTLDGVTYACSALPTGAGSTGERFRIIKPRWQVERYERLVVDLAPRTIFELGIYDGGSTAFLAQLAHPDKFVAIDLAESRCAALDEFLVARGFDTTVECYYGVNQADHRQLSEITDGEFGDRPIDLIIDDASHFVDETRSSFNTLFPRLRPDGCYVIEDWSWAHNDLSERLRGRLEGRLPLSIVVFEILLAAAHQPGVIASIDIRKGWAAVRRGPEAIAEGTFDLSLAYGKVGQDLVHRMIAT